MFVTAFSVAKCYSIVIIVFILLINFTMTHEMLCLYFKLDEPFIIYVYDFDTEFYNSSYPIPDVTVCCR